MFRPAVLPVNRRAFQPPHAEHPSEVAEPEPHAKSQRDDEILQVAGRGRQEVAGKEGCAPHGQSDSHRCCEVKHESAPGHDPSQLPAHPGQRSRNDLHPPASQGAGCAANEAIASAALLADLLRLLANPAPARGEPLFDAR